MFRIIARVLRKIARILDPATNQPEKEHVSYNKWVKDSGDKTHRLNYGLNQKSIVFDLGGYEGQWASDIFSKYQCTIFIFEPYSIYADNIKKRFELNPCIHLFPFGLSSSNSSSELYISDDASSIYKRATGSSVSIKLVSFTDFVNENKISQIDLIKINIEGGEYDILENLIARGWIKNIKNIQVQFHDFVPDAYQRMKAIQGALEKTHQLTYQYEFIWENWQLK